MHLCITPARAAVGELWHCTCDRTWVFRVEFGVRYPEWSRNVMPGGVR